MARAGTGSETTFGASSKSSALYRTTRWMKETSMSTKTIGIVLFPEFEDLDAIGPREALTMMAKGSGGEWEGVLISEDGGPVTSFLGTRYLADHSYENCPPLDVVLVPGGLGTRTQMNNQ